MTPQEAKKFINILFDSITNAKTIQDLENISDSLEIPTKNRMDGASYPQIKFNIQESEIDSLIAEGFIDQNLNFSKDLSARLSDPLTKLLYAIVWKNGDLKKVKHIIKGVIDGRKNTINQEEALVFYQFGRYLTKVNAQPIIDQHVIRAYGIYKESCLETIEKFQKMQTINKNHKQLMDCYIHWLKSNKLTDDLKRISDYSYHIDKLLFAAGKTVKIIN
jgi:hypothetical protein